MRFQESSFYTARILALLHDTPEIGIAENVCAVVQWFEEPGRQRTMQQCRLLCETDQMLRHIEPSDEVSVESISNVVAVARVFVVDSDSALGIRSSGSDENVRVHVRDCAYEQLQGFYQTD